MYRFNAEKTANSLRGDHVLISSVFLLVGLGLVTLYSASFAFAERFFGDGLYFIVRQLFLAAAGLVLFFIASWINPELLRKLVKPLTALAAILCVLTFIPGAGVVRNGAARWIRIGPWTYQPSEMVKLALPVYLAHIFDKKRDCLDSFRSGVLPPVLVTVLFFSLIYLQNNFSTAVFIALNALAVFFLAGVRLRYFFGAAVMFLPLSSLLILTKEHRVRRLISYIRPDWEPQGAGYQVRSSLLTVVSGGFWGKGIGQGTRKIASVPEIQSDFIFSAFAEESGFLGIMLFFLLFSVFAVQAYRGACKNGSGFERLLAAGLVTMIVSQALLNIAVVSGCVPATGIPLPFFSAGGSSLATTLVCAGLVVNVSRRGLSPGNGIGASHDEIYMTHNDLEEEDAG
ncbi:MAG: putative lipid II flippase FtsW [Treponema sp.]|jgi:cell division protein FtsW|nr:putative lipid II flippase FtsW [Treponema sp.]